MSLTLIIILYIIGVILSVAILIAGDLLDSDIFITDLLFNIMLSIVFSYLSFLIGLAYLLYSLIHKYNNKVIIKQPEKFRI
jgi:ABC-type Mn2+/Zn2+ transport system permease subunit